MLAEVYIATTHGLVSIQSIAPITDPDINSVITINQTSKIAGISNDYADFVNNPTGLIENEFSHGAFRLNISDNITKGQSWQLGCYIAHFLKFHGALSEDDNINLDNDFSSQTENKLIIIATGVVDTINKKVAKIESLPRKCQTANPQIQKWLGNGYKVIFLAPIDNLKDPIPDTSIQLTPIYQLKELSSLFKALGLLELESEQASNLAKTNKNHPLEQYDSAKTNIDGNTQIDTWSDKQKFKKLNNSSIRLIGTIAKFKWLIVFFVFMLVVLNFISFSASSNKLLALVTEHGNFPQCTNTSSETSLYNISKVSKPMESWPVFNAHSASIKKLCSLRVLTSQNVTSILMITDSKGLFKLSYNRSITYSDIKLLQSYNPNNDFDSSDLLTWGIPVPKNQSLNRSYYLVVSTYDFDAADIQSIESQLLDLYKLGRPISQQDISTILNAINVTAPTEIVSHLLTLN